MKQGNVWQRFTQNSMNTTTTSSSIGNPICAPPGFACGLDTETSSNCTQQTVENCLSGGTDGDPVQLQAESTESSARCIWFGNWDMKERLPQVKSPSETPTTDR